MVPNMGSGTLPKPHPLFFARKGSIFFAGMPVFDQRKPKLSKASDIAAYWDLMLIYELVWEIYFSFQNIKIEACH